MRSFVCDGLRNEQVHMRFGRMGYLFHAVKRAFKASHIKMPHGRCMAEGSDGSHWQSQL
jgi:hypothetical protein